jgi:hypothetical protein
MKRFLLPLTLIFASLVAEEPQMNLRDPVFTNGMISTDQGGIISLPPHLRIQARHIQYTNRIEKGWRLKKLLPKEIFF